MAKCVCGVRAWGGVLERKRTTASAFCHGPSVVDSRAPESLQKGSFLNMGGCPLPVSEPVSSFLSVESAKAGSL